MHEDRCASCAILTNTDKCVPKKELQTLIHLFACSLACSLAPYTPILSLSSLSALDLFSQLPWLPENSLQLLGLYRAACPPPLSQLSYSLLPASHALIGRLSCSVAEPCAGVDCSWTSDWSCPGHARGRKGVASDDGTFGYYCCCEGVSLFFRPRLSFLD